MIAKQQYSEFFYNIFYQRLSGKTAVEFWSFVFYWNDRILKVFFRANNIFANIKKLPKNQAIF